MSRLEFTAQAVPGPSNPLLDENISSVKFGLYMNLPGPDFLRIKEMLFNGTGSLATQSWCNQFLPDLVEPPPPAAAAKSLQSCPTLRDPIDGSPVPGILQARIMFLSPVFWFTDSFGK